MSELQIGLLSIGALLVVAVYLYGFWQQRSYRSKFGSSSKSPHEKALYKSNSAAADAELVFLLVFTSYWQSYWMLELSWLTASQVQSTP